MTGVRGSLWPYSTPLSDTVGAKFTIPLPGCQPHSSCPARGAGSIQVLLRWGGASWALEGVRTATFFFEQGISRNQLPNLLDSEARPYRGQDSRTAQDSGEGPLLLLLLLLLLFLAAHVPARAALVTDWPYFRLPR